MNNSQEITPILSKRPRSLFFEDYNDNLCKIQQIGFL